jgi:tetratricopeptide (TPR) repeat protein
LAEAHVALGRLVWTPARGYQHGEAIRAYGRALALNPRLDEARFQLGQVLAHAGFLDEALAQFAQAVEQDSDNVRARDAGVAQVLLFQGKYADALSALRRAPADLNPTLLGMEKAWALFGLGRSDESLAILDEYGRNSPEDPAGTFASMRAVIHAARGSRREVDRLIATAAEKNRNSLQYHHTAYNIGVAYALLGPKLSRIGSPNGCLQRRAVDIDPRRQSSARRQRSGEHSVTAPEVAYVAVRNRSHQIENPPLFEGLGHPAERRRPPPRMVSAPGPFNQRGLDALDMVLVG